MQCRSPTAVSLVHCAAQQKPDGLALRYLDSEREVETLTYSQIWALSGRIAKRLTGSTLAVAIDDGPYLALAELAGWRCGMVLVPMDPHDPVSRLRGVVDEASISCVVTKDWGDAKKLQEAVCDKDAAIPVIDLSAEVPLLDGKDAAQEGVLCQDAQLDPDAAAYMWFTSGSTGKPKGVLVSHRSFHNWCVVKNEPHGISSQSVVLIASACTFDPSIGDIFATWAAGGLVAVAPRMLLFANLAWVIAQLEVSHLTCTPSLWQFMEADMPLPTLTTVCFGGERCPQPLLDLWTPRRTIFNTYGTTECTVWQTLRLMRPGDRATLVGQTYPNNKMRVMRQGCFEVAPPGEQGEILQGGVQVGIGYHNRPELTAEKFVTIPGEEGRWYRTGDGGRMVPTEDGGEELEVLGRFDNQVKIRGMRVELGDIEAGVVKASCGLLSNCCVVLRDKGFLHAYCQVSTSAAVMMHEACCIFPVVSDFLLQRSSLELPRHMLPSRFILLQQLPLNSNGKVNSKQLPQVADDDVVATGTSSSLTPLEALVAGVWSEVLGRKQAIAAGDHFLALGGHSLSVLQVSRKLLALAAAAGQDVSPRSSVAVLLAPEKLIHVPRLRPYCQMLARGGVRFEGGSSGQPPPDADEKAGAERAEEEAAAAATLRINYTKHKVKRPKLEEEMAELDHAAWEQAPKASIGELLCRASEAGLLPLVQLLMEQGAPVEGHLTGHFLRHQLTPLHLAVGGNHVCCAELLLEKTANVMLRDAHGVLPLQKAAERCGPRMIDLLVQAGADAEAIDTASRSTALHLAARAGNLPSVRALVAHGGLDWLDRWNRTALHWAAFHGHLEICSALVEAGACLRGTVGERAGRFCFVAAPCGNLPQRVSRRVGEFLTPSEIAQERFGKGPLVDLLSCTPESVVTSQDLRS